METLTKTKTNFKPILLAKDEERMAASIKNHQDTAKRLNEALAVGLKFVEKDLDDKGKEDLLKGGFKKAMDIIRPDFQFPKADDAFNLESIGKDPEPVKLALRSTPAWYHNDHYKVENGSVVLADNLKSLVEAESSTFTKNEKQNEAYGLALGICDNLNEARRIELIGRIDTSEVDRGLKLVRWDSIEQNFYPNPSFIKQIDPDGVIRSMY